MQVKLRVIQGPSAGKEFKLPVDTFLIGRGDGCHLKPKSDMVSRKHCALTVRDSKLFIEEFGSKNGTFVNNERIEGSVELKMGDEIRIGPLEFLVLIDHTLGAVKRSKVSSVQEAASRMAQSSSVGSDVASWLEEADEVEKAQRLDDPETRQFRIDETRTIPSDEVVTDEAPNESDEETVKKTKSGVLGLFGGSKPKAPKKAKKEYGKLPPRASDKPVDSQEAANSAIKKLFERR